MLVFTLPDWITSNSSAAPASRSARFAMYENSVGRVKNSEPRYEKSFESIGGSGPDAFPKLTNSPSGARQSSEPIYVSLPIES